MRQVFAAKNALSRVGGFTPAQALLGKSRHIPGSLTGHEDVGSHSLAVSDDPEGQWFLKTLARREQADTVSQLQTTTIASGEPCCEGPAKQSPVSERRLGFV